MKKVKKDSLFKRGIWIKNEQEGLMIGSLDESDEKVMRVPDILTSKILEFEKDMIEALYGEESENKI